MYVCGRRQGAWAHSPETRQAAWPKVQNWRDRDLEILAQPVRQEASLTARDSCDQDLFHQDSGGLRTSLHPPTGAFTHVGLGTDE